MKLEFKDIVTSIDVLNTIQGGLSEPFLSMIEDEEGREVRVRVPGVNKTSLQVEVINNQLAVFYMIPIHSNGKLLRMSQVIYNNPIPYFVEASKIKATYEENELIVELPFNELSGGYKRKIKIG